MKQEMVILVDENDREVGQMEKMEAHYKGVLHRAFSVFLFNNKGEVLLQRRALTKYHSGGLWTNACCSHPRKGETLLEAAHRRLDEELGIDCDIWEVHQFVYRAELDHDMIEHELDHVLVGQLDCDMIPFNTDEVDRIDWMNYSKLVDDMSNHPEKYTEWFKIIMSHLSEEILLGYTSE